MNEILNIDLFKKLMVTEKPESSILEALKKFTEIDDTSELSARVKGPKPLGSWTGWSF